MYKTPEDFHLRLHFERSRFNRRLEDMLLLLAGQIVNIGIMEKAQFEKVLDDIIRKMNSGPVAEKTIKNQRTEMIRLFGLVKYVDGLAIPGNRLVSLAQTQDIPRFFKSYCKQFQYPGGFLKPDKVAELVVAGVKFKPAKYILQMMKIAESKYGEFGISAAEVTHFIFNDKRVTVQDEKPIQVLERIKETRQKKTELDKTSDVIRYARDFLNYMVEANLLNEFEGIYTLNNKEARAIHYIIADNEFFDGYSKVIKPDGTWDTEEYRQVDLKWAEWFADEIEDEALQTPATALIKDDANFPDQMQKIKEMLEKKDAKARGGALKEIGDEGEQIAFEYEKGAIAKVRPDMVHMVKLVSNMIGLGYDLLSIHADDGRRKKYIEVKTTKKNYESEFAIPFMMSINEWSVAEQHGNDYFIYRVIITKEGITIFAIQDPPRQNKEGNLIIEPIAYKVVYSSKSGKYLDL